MNTGFALAAMICLTCNTSNAEAAQFCNGCGAGLQHPSDARSQLPSSEEHITQQSSGAETTIAVERDGDPLLGSTIAGRYHIEAKIGAGGMGAVYRATRVTLGDNVAVKILHSNHGDPNAVPRFRREAQAAAKLKHPNAVTIHDFGITDDGLQYLVMDLVEGRTLRQIIKQDGPITASASGEILTQLCAALEEAHRHNIIHRDIKPDNIIVDATATGLNVKVLDFGIAKLRDDNANTLTQTGSILGTPHYMSPEQCLGEELDARSDIYSVGIVLYEMLTGVVPFSSPSSAAVVVQHVTQAPPSLRARNLSLSHALEKVVFKALEKQRVSRPQTASDLARQFEAAMSGVTPTQSNDAPSQHSSSPLDLGGSPTVVQASHKRLVLNSTIDHGTKPSRRSPLIVPLLVVGAVVLVVLGGAIAWALLGNREANQKPAPSRVQISATASSVLAPASGTSYQPGNTLDGLLNTAWVEGADGMGVGQWIRFEFDREVTLRALTIHPGYFKSPVIWSINNRLAAITIQFSDGSVQRHRLNDRMEPQQLTLGSIKTSWANIVIDEVYLARDQKDTALSEVSFDFADGVSASTPGQNIPSAPLATASYDAVEARVVNGQMIGSSDLTGLTKDSLQRLRNAVYARHGRSFDKEYLQQYFNSKPWYSLRLDYRDQDLTLADKANINLIQTAENAIR